jgi:hypothetical protein
MEAGLCSVSEGGATAQVEQVKSLSSGVSWATESDCSLASRGRGECVVGPRIQLWEAGLVSQTLSRRRAMEEVRLPVCTWASVFSSFLGKEPWRQGCLCLPPPGQEQTYQVSAWFGAHWPSLGRWECRMLGCVL